MTTEALQSERRHPQDVVLNDHAHWTHEQRLTENYVEGQPVRAPCGIVFVPTRLQMICNGVRDARWSINRFRLVRAEFRVPDATVHANEVQVSAPAARAGDVSNHLV
ncbi:DUF3039 domain-containing protein [Prescottella equi]